MWLHCRQNAFAICLIFFFVLFFSHVSCAENTITLRSFTVEAQEKNVVLVDSGIILSNLPEIKSLLRDGAVINLNCKLTCKRVRSFLTNKTLAELNETYQIRHDTLTREFVLIQPNGHIERNPRMETLLKTWWEKLCFTIPLSAPLVSGETYRVQLDVNLQHAKIPPWLEKALFFWSWEIAPSASFTQEFTY